MWESYYAKASQSKINGVKEGTEERKESEQRFQTSPSPSKGGEM